MKSRMVMNTGAASRAGKRSWLWLLAAAAFGWTVLVLAVYYRQLWRLALGEGWETMALNTGPSDIHFGRQLLYLGAALALVWAMSYWRRRFAPLLYVVSLLLLGAVYLRLTQATALLTIDPALPFLDEAVRSHVIGVVVAALLLTAAVTLGLGISRICGWRYDHWRERLAFGGALGIGAFANLGLLLALAGLYRPVVLGGIVGLVLLGGIVALAVQVRQDGLHLPTPRLPHGATGLWVACGGLAVLAAGIAALAPESQFDAVWYHLPYAQRYLQAGYLVDVPADFVSLYPMTAELWLGYGLAFGGATAAILLHGGCLLLSAVAACEMARRFVPSASPALAVALMLTAPTVVWEASTAYIDLFMMLFITLSFYALLRCVDGCAGGLRWQWLLLAALNLGFALASKHLALFALILFCPGLLLALWLRKVPWRKALPAVVVFGALSLLLAMPWYLRSYFATGNPVFETMYAFFGSPPDRWNAQTDAALRRFLAVFGRPRTLMNTLTLPWHMTVHAGAYDGTLGPLFLILLPLLALRRMRRALPWLIGFVTLFVLLWASPLASFELRHLMPITPVLGVLGASGFARGAALARSAVNRRAPALLAGGLAVLMVLNLPPFTFLHEGDRVNWDGWLTSVLHTVPLGVVIGGESTDTYLTRQISSYPVWQFAGEALPPDARVLTWSEGDNLYTHHERIWANSALAIATAWAKAGHEEEALAGLRRMGITHLIIDKRPLDGPDGWNAYALTGPLARTDWYEQLYEDYNYVLYRIRWEALGGES